MCLKSTVAPAAGSLHEAASPTEATASTFFSTLSRSLSRSSVFFIPDFFFSFFIFTQRDERASEQRGRRERRRLSFTRRDKLVKHYENTGLLVARASQRTKGEKINGGKLTFASEPLSHWRLTLAMFTFTATR